MDYHVSKSGNDRNEGTAKAPFLTISRAAAFAEAGDTVTVHEGEYRECVNPANGGIADCKRITYKAADGERVIIKGSEIITDWEGADGIWKATIPSSFFGEHNPYTEIIDGDWFMEPLDHPPHTGQVYIDGNALAETDSVENVKNNALTWYAEEKDGNTVIYANFAGNDPKNGTVEINVRRSCFCPEKTGVNYITVSGFEMAHAATQWAPPTAEQTGMLSVNWSKGWIIENNILHDSRCSAICVGKERTTGHNEHIRYRRKPGCQTQLETVFAAWHIGWDREHIGSHIIRNNTIYDCGQTAIVGHMCGAFSEIYGNHIYNIANKREFYGFEIAGIKLHAAIDTYIHHNNIHDCLLGTWLDWEAQGVRLSGNVYWNNETDVWVEVTHGPHIFDNNIFGSKKNLINAAQGGAFIHNLFCGASSRYDVRNRPTPYHIPHSTEIMGCTVVFGGDDRYFNNMFVGVKETDGWSCGTKKYNGYTVSMDEFIRKASEKGRGDIENYENVPQPVYINNNFYLSGAEPFDGEEICIRSDMEAKVRITEETDRIVLEIDIPEGFDRLDTHIIRSHSLEFPRMTGAPYEAADGAEIIFDTDCLGAVRCDRPLPGALEKLTAGHNRIIIGTI
ncbi:MAG: right-handed parallel beta-helix repeat-containing protein [Clostridia bacterium]|nr:right-handed parallel beta-helix repeat-containing protein [Clostridia bacterium]